MSINEQGFLSEDMQHYRQHIHKQRAGYFDLIEWLNAFCQDAKYRLEIHQHNPQQILAGCLMIKLLNDTQGAILLVEHGLASQARVVLRTALETLFVLGNVCFDEHFSRSFLAASERKRLKHLRAIHNNPSVAFDAVRPTITPELLDELAQEIEDTGVTEKSAEALARRAGVGYLYDGVYRLFSQDVHASPRALEQYLVCNETRELTGFAWGPETEDVQAELTVASRVMILGFMAINQLFGLRLDAKLQSLDEALRHLENPPGATTET